MKVLMKVPRNISEIIFGRHGEAAPPADCDDPARAHLLDMSRGLAPAGQAQVESFHKRYVASGSLYPSSVRGGVLHVASRAWRSRQTALGCYGLDEHDLTHGPQFSYPAPNEGEEAAKIHEVFARHGYASPREYLGDIHGAVVKLQCESMLASLYKVADGHYSGVRMTFTSHAPLAAIQAILAAGLDTDIGRSLLDYTQGTCEAIRMSFNHGVATGYEILKP